MLLFDLWRRVYVDPAVRIAESEPVERVLDAVEGEVRDVANRGQDAVENSAPVQAYRAGERVAELAREAPGAAWRATKKVAAVVGPVVTIAGGVVLVKGMKR